MLNLVSRIVGIAMSKGLRKQKKSVAAKQVIMASVASFNNGERQFQRMQVVPLSSKQLFPPLKCGDMAFLRSKYSRRKGLSCLTLGFWISES